MTRGERLARFGAGGEPRVGMLETIREYALERLGQGGDLDDTRRRHAEHYAAFAERAHGQLRGTVHLGTLDRLEAEHDNLRAALSWSLESPAASWATRTSRHVHSTASPALGQVLDDQKLDQVLKDQHHQDSYPAKAALGQT